MKNSVKTTISGVNSSNQTGSTIYAGQLVSASFQASFGDTTAAGTFKLQASNDPLPVQYNPTTFEPTNWTDVPTQTATITSGGSALLTIANMAYQWIRAVYTTTATGAQVITAIADTGRKQVQTIDTVADVAGSLNSTYFLISSVNLTDKAQKDFYVWLDNGTGVDPAIDGKTGVQITYSNDDTADTIAGNIRTALALLTNDFTITGATSHIIATDKAYGLVTASADSVAAPTGFTFHDTAPGVASNLSGKYFLLNRKGQPVPPGGAYYVWFNVDTISTDPAPAGKTAIAVAVTSGTSASTIGGTMATAIAAVNSSADFSAVNTSGAVTVTNSAAGPFTRASDFNSGFTFSVTAGGTSTITVNANLLSI